MGTLLVSALITSYRRILLDPAPGVTWLDADFLRMVNKAERLACLLKPEILVVRGSIPMVAGTHQTIPATWSTLFDLYENTGSKRRVSQVNRADLDASSRTWPAATPEQDVQHWTFDPRTRKQFECFPPNDASGAVNGLGGLIPTAIAAVGNAINLDDIYEAVLEAFVVSLAYAENTTRQDLAKSASYDTLGKQLLGVSTQTQVATAQKSATPGGQ